MEKEEAIKELKLYQKERARARFLENKLAELRSQMEFPPHNDVHVDGGKSGGAIEFMLDKLAEVERTYLAQLSYCYGIVNDVGAKIDMLNFPHDFILRQYYLEKNTLEEICYTIKYSYASTKRHKERALEEYCRLPKLYSQEYWEERTKVKS